MDQSESNGDILMHLARHNAPTLRTLNISLGETESISQLLQNVDGSYVQYPYLTSLKLCYYLSWNDAPNPVFPGAIPFPNLQKLSFRDAYLFGDDTPFRGNSSTLKVLGLYMDLNLVAVLRGFNVFTPGSHPKLQCVKLDETSDFIQKRIGTVVEYMQFLLSIGPDACVRHAYHKMNAGEFRPAISAFGKYDCIQELSLPNTSLGLWDVIALVKSLPLLTDLGTGFSKLDAWPSGISKHSLPAYMIANYAPIGERFRCWHLLPYWYPDSSIAVKCVLLLALVCPNFGYAAIGGSNRESFMALIKTTITTDGFRPYATRLRRLLFGGSKNEIPSIKTIQAAKEAERQMWQVADLE
ncbi:hypothetical protein H4R27_004493 [Coemansia aciculifera]|nr:hypothetical protein H4R27_004493 [Coemansia aciculifera]